VALIYVAAAALGGVGLVVSRVDRPNAYILAGIVAALALFLGSLLARVPVYGDQTRARSRPAGAAATSLSSTALSSTSTVRSATRRSATTPESIT